MSDGKDPVICGARCIFQKKGKCTWSKKGFAVIIGIDAKCIKFESAEKK